MLLQDLSQEELGVLLLHRAEKAADELAQGLIEHEPDMHATLNPVREILDLLHEQVTDWAANTGPTGGWISDPTDT